MRLTAFHKLGAILCAAALWLVPAIARGDARPLTTEETARLLNGETIVREQTVTSDDDEDHRWIGGVAYTVVDATPDEVLSLAGDEAAFAQILPRVKTAKRVDGNGDDQHVQITQGTSLVTASYVLHVRKYQKEQTLRFWLDPAYAHGIDDAWGFVRATPITTTTGEVKTLVTYGALVDIGQGFVRAFYEERLRAAMLSVPQLLRAYVKRSIREPRTG